jgi:serine/threonine-protein kinase
MSHWYRLTRPDLGTALQYFELSLEKDPNNALAHVGIALVWMGRRQVGFTMPDEAGPKARAAIQKALELNDLLAEAHYVLAINKTWGEWDWEAAGTAFLRAIELNPNLAEIRAYYAHWLMIMKRQDEAMVEMERALELDPFNPLLQQLCGGLLLYGARRPDDSIEVWQRSFQLAPDLPVAGQAWMAYAAKGLYEEAFDYLKEVHLIRGDSEIVGILERGYREGGFRGAMRMLGDHAAKHDIRSTKAAFYYAMAGEDKEALDWLEQGFEEGSATIPYTFVFPAFDGLWDEPRFQDMLHRMNFPEDVLARYLNEGR